MYPSKPATYALFPKKAIDLGKYALVPLKNGILLIDFKLEGSRTSRNDSDTP